MTLVFSGVCVKDNSWVPVDGFGPLLYLENVSVMSGKGRFSWEGLVKEYSNQTSEVIMGKRGKEQVYIPEIHSEGSSKHFCFLTAYIPSPIESTIYFGERGIPTHESVWDDSKKEWIIREKKGLYDR